MRLLVSLACVASGCGYYAYIYDARAVVGVPTQRVPAASLPAGATTLAIRSGATMLVYPLRADGTDLVVDSPYADSLPVTYDASDDAAITGALPVALAPPATLPPGYELPGPLDYTGELELSVGTTTIGIRLAPVADPCADPVIEIAPAARSTAGVPFASAGSAVAVPPFAIQIVVQVSCSIAQS